MKYIQFLQFQQLFNFLLYGLFGLLELFGLSIKTVIGRGNIKLKNNIIRQPNINDIILSNMCFVWSEYIYMIYINTSYKY